MGSYLRTGFGTVKQFLGNTYATTKKTLGTMDSVFGDVKKIYGALQPALQDLAPQQLQGGLGKLDSAVMKGVQGYENVRNRIDDAEGQAVGNQQCYEQGRRNAGKVSKPKGKFKPF